MFAKATLALCLALPFVAQSVFAAECSRKYIVKAGDICDTISAANNVSTYQLASVNQGVIDADCQNLIPGESICLAHAGEDCSNVYVVAPGDDCEIIETKFGINSTVLYQSNPQINQDCTNIYIAEVLCIGGGTPPPPAGVDVKPPPHVIPANPSATNVHPPHTPTPTPGHDGNDDNLPYCDEL